jgi:RNA polymerase sigma-70 factor, ECF subfamily
MTVTRDDEAAFTRLYEDHQPGVHAFLLARTSDAEVARDLLQETFLRAWRRCDELAALEPGRQRGWLYTVARNLVIDRYRSEGSRRSAIVDAEGEARRVASLQVDAEDAVTRRDDLAVLEEAIGELPEDERTILTMVAVGEMTSQQVGEALDLPPGTVRYRLHRARTRLADRLERR